MALVTPAPELRAAISQSVLYEKKRRGWGAEINTEHLFIRVEPEIAFKNKSGRKSTYESLLTLKLLLLTSCLK